MLLFTLTARAQVSPHRSRALANSSLFNGHDSAVKSDTGGINGGAFYNAPIHSGLNADIDARGSYAFDDRGGTSAAAALRLGLVPDRVAIPPYYQLGGGLVRSTFTNRQLTGPVIQGLTTQPTRLAGRR